MAALTKAQKQANINKYADAIIDGTQKTTLLPSVAMAQLILETGYMQHVVGKNLFGIKANGAKTAYWNGAAVKAGTQEYYSSTPSNVTGLFRAYNSEADSIKDRTAFLQTNSRYRNVFKATTAEQQCFELQKAGYATAPDYAKLLKSIIATWNLKELDKKKTLCEL